MNPRTVLVTGATGFLGRHIAQALRARGHDVVALVRRRRAAERIPEIAGCRLREGDLLDPASLHGAADGAEAVIHLVGIIRERGAQTFEAVVTEGTAAVIAEARRARVRRFLFQSAIGADPQGPTKYFRTKGRAEEMVRTSGLDWLVLRASVVIGKGGEFLPLARFLAQLPVLPLPGGGRSQMQPVAVDDLATLHLRAIENEAGWNQTYAVCGPQPYSLAEMVQTVAHKRRWVLPVPWSLATIGAWLGQWVLPFGPLTPDGLTMLRRGSVCDASAARAAFGWTPHGVDALLTEEAG